MFMMAATKGVIIITYSNKCFMIDYSSLRHLMVLGEGIGLEVNSSMIFSYLLMVIIAKCCKAIIAAC